MRASLTLGVLVLLLLGPVAHALPPAKDYATVPHTGVDYPMGTVELEVRFADNVQLHYPAIEDGVKTQMAGNAQFPVVLFIPTDGEGSGDYELFSAALVARGFIVAVVDGLTYAPADVSRSLARVYEVNEGDGSVPGAIGSMDSRWAIGGHGEGAAAALEVAGSWPAGPDFEPPSGLFGLGLSDDGGLIGDEGVTEDALDLVFAEPSVGLLLTGSVDTIAPVESNVLPLLDAGMDLGLHVMTVRGANHHQWKDSTGLFDGNDGTATLSQEDQHSIAANHVVAFLDLTTRGDHDSFSVAFNRPLDPGVLSDSDAYLDEDLSAAEMLRLNVTSPTNASGTAVSGTLLFEGQIGLWDGSDWFAEGRPAEMMCWFEDGSSESTGSVNQTGWFSCSLDVSDVEPGPFKASMRATIDGAPVTRTLSLNRVNGPLESLAPVPAVIVPQGGSATLHADTLAVDPDGQDVRFTNVQLQGTNASRFDLTLLPDGSSVEIGDASDVDWLGGALLNASLSAAGETSPLQVSVQVRMGAVDNPVELLATPPTLVFDEDGPEQTLDVSNYALDPEGVPLQMTVAGGLWSELGPVRAAVVGSNLSVVPLANASGSVVVPLVVGDGTTSPVALNVTVVVKPVNDAPLLNQTRLEVVLAEDAVLDLDLSLLAWDADGDLPVVSLVDVPETLVVLEVVDEWRRLEVRPLQHANGRIDTMLRFQFPDAVLDLPLMVTVEPMEDVGSIRLDWVRSLGENQIEVRWTVEDRDDLTNVSFSSIMQDGDGLPMVEAGTRSCGPALLDERGIPLWSVTCTGVWALPSGSLLGMTLRVEEPRPASEPVVVYVLPVPVEAVSEGSALDNPEGGIGSVFFLGGAVVLAILALMAWRFRE
jgi:hypothetical protein